MEVELTLGYDTVAVVVTVARDTFWAARAEFKEVKREVDDWAWMDKAVEAATPCTIVVTWVIYIYICIYI